MESCSQCTARSAAGRPAEIGSSPHNQEESEGSDLGESKGIAQWAAWGPQLRSLLRIVAAFMFMLAGTSKLFAFPQGMPPDGATAEFLSQVWIGGFLEVFGGALMLVGFWTRPVAFILAGEMAVAYFQFHAPQGFWPTLNGGVAAVMYCFVWLYFSAAGAGPWSVDACCREKTKT